MEHNVQIELAETPTVETISVEGCMASMNSPVLD